MCGLRSISQSRIHVGTVNRRVTAGVPAGSHLQKRRVIRVADINVPGRNIRALHLRVAAQAKIRVALDEHFLVDRAVRTVAGDAAFAQRRMFKHKRPRLVAMTLRAAFILPRHRQPARRFENVPAMRIVTLHAAHVAFDDWMMLRQIEFRVDVEMTLKTGRRIVARIDDELRSTAGLDMFAAGTVAGFATSLAGHRHVFKMNARVRAGGKFLDDFLVAIRAGLVADVMRAGNFQRHRHRARRRVTGN